MEEQKRPLINFKTEGDFHFEPDDIEIMSMNAIYTDYTLWQKWCELAADLGTDPGTLWGIFQANILKELGRWDPDNTKDLPVTVKVTVSNLIDSPLASQMGPNPFYQDHLNAIQPPVVKLAASDTDVSAVKTAEQAVFKGDRN